MLPSCLSSQAPARSQRPLALAAPLCWVTVLLLAGCGGTPPKASTAPSPPVAMVIAIPVAPGPEMLPPASVSTTRDSAEPVSQLLAQTDRLLRLAPTDLNKEIARLSDAEDASGETLLILATALAQTRQPVDTARALGLVQRVLGNNAPVAQALHPLARLIEARLLQQRRLEDQLDRQAQQLRDSQRRNDQLNERLEAVRAIERSLTTRPAAPPTAAPTSPNGGGAQRLAP